tara:strand:- start:1141 stop:1896 length:756 start_codon:yes stop_codon:yes gene_type:complete
MKNLPNIDIIIPNYNKGDYLRECLDSVLNQTYKNWKVYLVDDCSNDTSKDILKEYNQEEKINIIFLNENFGPSYCRNLGIKNSKSEHIAFLDSDDFWPENKLEVQINEMLTNRYNFSYTDIKYFFDNKSSNLKKTNLPKVYDFKKFIRKSTMSTSSILVNRSIINNTYFKNVKHEDFLFKCELLKKGNNSFKTFNTFVYYRINKNNRSSNKISNILNLWKINKLYNKLNFINNLMSVLSISFNSLKTYGWK